MRRSENGVAEVLRGFCGGCGGHMSNPLKSLNAEVLRKCGSMGRKSLILFAGVLRAEVPHTPCATSAWSEVAREGFQYRRGTRCAGAFMAGR